jgi:hypothetical protein
MLRAKLISAPYFEKYDVLGDILPCTISCE